MPDITSPSPRTSSLILIADDDRAIRSLLLLALQEEGYEVEESINGEDCLRQYDRLRPDLVLLDAVMPEMDGLTCCEKLRALPDGREVPILMITFLDDRESIDQAFAAGATDYITKPIHWSVLRQRVKRLLDSARRAGAGASDLWERFLRHSLRWYCQSADIAEILTGAREFFGVQRIVFFPADRSGPIESVTPGYSSGDDLPWLEPELEARYQGGETIAIDDLSGSGLASADRLAEAGIKALLIVPLLARGRFYGALRVDRDSPYSWLEGEIERFVDLANLLALSYGG